MSNYKNKFSLKIATALLCVLFTAKLFAQQPVQIVPQLVSPYSLSLSDYYSGTTPKLYVTITNRDLQQPSLKVKLRVSITGTSVQLKSNPVAYYPTITLDAGVPQRLSQADLEPYFNPNNLDFQGISKAEYLKTRKLPEGMYNFCFEAVEANTNQVLSKSECAMAWISLSDPPLLNSPFNGVGIAALDPTNIIFNWTPRHLNSPNGAFNTEYLFEMVEIFNNNIDPNAAFQSLPIFYSTTTTATTMLYGAAQPLLMIGRKYAWRIKVKANTVNEDKDEFRNGGYSNVNWFAFNDKCEAPKNINATANADHSFTIKWTAAPNIIEHDIEYREISDENSKWVYKTVANITEFKIPNAQLGSQYDYRILSKCGAGTGNVSSDLQHFDMSKGLTVAGLPNTKPVKGKVLWAYYGSAEEPSTENKPLVTTDNKASLNNDKYENINRDADTSSKKRMPFKKAEVFLYAYSNSLKVETCIAHATTNANGEYTLNIDPTLIKKEDAVYISIMPPTKTISIFGRGFTYLKSASTLQKFELNAINTYTFFAKTIDFTPTVFSPSISADIAKSVAIDVLLEKTKWETMYGSFANELGVNANTTVQYNNETYVVVKTLNTGDAYKKLLQLGNGTYILKIKSDAGVEVFGKMFSNNASRITKTLKYDINSHLSGVVKSYGKPADQTKITVKVKVEDVVGSTKNYAVDNGAIYLNTTADNAGEYNFNNLPYLKPNSKISVTLVNRTITPDLITDSVITNNSNAYTKNINIENKVYTFFGRLIDQYNKPVANALITMSGSNETTHSTNDGYYMIKASYLWNKHISVTANRYSSEAITLDNFGQQDFAAKKMSATPENWKALIENAVNIQGYNLQNITADVLGIGQGSIAGIYPNYINKNSETLAGVKSHGATILQNKNASITVSILLNDKKVKANINVIRFFGNGRAEKLAPQVATAGQDWIYTNLIGKYKFKITPTGKDENFVPFEGEFNVNFESTLSTNNTIVRLTPAVLLKGLVKSSQGNVVIEDAAIALEGLPNKTNTNTDGNFDINLQNNTYYKLHISKTGFTSLDTAITLTATNAVLNVTLKRADVKITTLSGFAVTIDKQESTNQDNTYKISGKIKLTQNDVFTTPDNNTELTFKDIIVNTVENTGKAIATDDIRFEQSTIQTTAFGYMPIEIVGVKLSKLSNANNYERGVIGGDKLTTRLSTVGQATSIPIKLQDAEMTNATTDQASNNFKYVYIAYDSNIAAFHEDAKFKLEFNDNSKTEYLEANIMPLVSLYIKKKEAGFDKDGINMGGYFQIPTSISPYAGNGGRIGMKSFGILKNFSSYKVEFDLGENHPYILPLYKIRAKLTSLTLVLGENNYGVKFGGKIWLKKEDSLSTDGKGILTINELSIIKIKDGVTLSGDFALPEEGITIKSLVFKASRIAMSYNTDTHDFEMETSGSVGSNSTSEDGIFKTVFKDKIEIQLFKLTTKKFGLFLVAKPNLQLDFKVMKVNITKLLVNVGYGMSMDKMNDYLLADSAGIVKLNNEPKEVVNENEPIEETQTSWAVGIAGGIEFPIKQLKVAVSASLIVGDINNKIEVRLNEIELNIDNAPTFVLNVKVNLSFDEYRTGFDAQGKLEILGNTVGARLTYYSIKAHPGVNAGLELGAEISYEPAKAISFPPVDILGIGGGFHLNTSTNVYSIFVSGKFTVTGVQKEMAYLDVERIELLFSTNDCGAKPVIQGSASLYIKDSIWGTMQAKIDFCKLLFFVTLDAKVPILPSLIPKIQVTGVLYGDYPNKSLFLGINADITSNMVSGNALIALGYNYKYKEADSRILDDLNSKLAVKHDVVDIKTFWDKIPQNAKDADGSFSAIYLSAAVNLPGGSGGFDAGFVGCSYGYSGSGDAKLFYKFKDKIFYAGANISFTAWGDAFFIGIKAHGDVSLNAGLEGGKNESGWWLDGHVNARLNMRAGSDEVPENDWKNSAKMCSTNKCASLCWPSGISWSGITYDCCCYLCADVPYPCGWICGFKINKSLNAKFSYREGKPISASLD